MIARWIKRTLLLLLFTLIYFTVSAAIPTSASTVSIGKINFILGKPGDVRIKHSKNKNWLNARLGMKVFNKDRLVTRKEARCEVLMTDGSIVRIGENTEFQITSSTTGKTSRKVETVLKKGKIWANVRLLRGKNTDWRVKGPTAVCAVRGTIYRVNADSSTHVMVYDGEVEVGPRSDIPQKESAKPKSLQPYQVPGPTEIPPPYEVTLDEWVRIVAGFQIQVRPDGKYAKSRIAASDEKLDWVQWNRKRDNALK